MKTFGENDFYGNLNLAYDVIPFISRFHALLTQLHRQTFRPILKESYHLEREQLSISCARLLKFCWFCFTLLCDCFRQIAPLSEPICTLFQVIREVQNIREIN